MNRNCAGSRWVATPSLLSVDASVGAQSPSVRTSGLSDILQRLPNRRGTMLLTCGVAWGWAILSTLGTLHAGSPTPSPLRPWDDYRVILWVGDSAARDPSRFDLFVRRMQDLGVDTAMVTGAEGDAQPFVTRGFPFYVENIVNKGLCLKWNSDVRDWDKFVTAWTTDGRPDTAFVRPYCLDDPQWTDWAKDRMRAAALAHAKYTPLAYDIRDELSVTLSANPFDYDFAPRSLDGFRTWLRSRYADLTTLNREWETSFSRWEDVRPFTTDQIKNRMASGEAQPRGRPDWQALQRVVLEPVSARQHPTRWNFAPWADFRTYMDVALARTLGTLRDAAHAVDPQTPVGIEGTQMPHAFGGYDLWRLAQVLDWVEPYDIGNARDILGSFMPNRPILSTVFENETRAARRRLWHLLLEGDRGCIVWWSEDCIDWRSPSYDLTAKGRALSPVFAELKSPLARLFLRAEKIHDPVFIHYSQPSIQVDWLIESTVDGATWHRRFSSFEAEHNRLARVRNAWLKVLQDLGFSPKFLASEQLESMRRPNTNTPFTLILPRSLAMSHLECVAVGVQAWSNQPDSSPRMHRQVLADGPVGIFDEHGRLRDPVPSVFERPMPWTTNPVIYASPDLQPATQRLDFDTASYARQRLQPDPPIAFPAWLARQLPPPPVEVALDLNENAAAGTPSETNPPAARHAARTRVHRYRLADALLLAVERNIDYHMSENLKQAGGNEPLERAVNLVIQLGTEHRAGHVYDLRSGRKLAEGRRWTFTLDPWQPSLFAVLPTPPRDGAVMDALTGAFPASTNRQTAIP